MSRVSLLVLLVTMFTSPLLRAENTVSLGVTLNGAKWSGDNGSGRSTFSSTEGGQFGLSANVNLDRLYLGISLQGGEYSFNGDAPDQFTAAGAVSASGTAVKHSDFDLLAGYYFWPRVSLFVDLKGASSRWQNNGYEQSFGGLGIGVSAYQPINQKWLFFGSLGFVGGGIEDSDKAELGDGRSRSLVAGGVYSIEKNQHLNFGFRFRKFRFDFDDGNSQDYTMNGVFLGYTHIFRWQ